MPKVAVLGYYGYGNFGDDEAVLGGLKQLFMNWDIEVYAATSESRFPVFNYDAVNSCDLFVLGGGNLIWGDRLFFYSPLVRYSFIPAAVHRRFRFGWSKKIRVPKAVLGCGLDTAKLSFEVLRELYNFDYIGVRDTFSFNALSSYPFNCGLCYDLALANKIECSPKKFGDVAVVVPTDRVGLDAVSKSGVWLKEQLANFRSAVFVPFGKVDNDDYKTCRCLADICGKDNVVLRGPVSFGKMVTLLSSCGAVVAYRLHSLILAYMVGAKYSFYPYHKKLTYVHETLAEKSLAEIKDKQRGEFRKVLELIK